MNGRDSLIDIATAQTGHVQHCLQIRHNSTKLRTTTDARTDPGYFCSLPVALPDESAWGAGPLMLQLPCTHDDGLNSACKKAMRLLKTGHHLLILDKLLIWP